MSGATVAQDSHNAMGIKPIETRAYGHRFRSRLEARWAVFFTELGCSWQYEPEGFELPYSGFYLPDFLVSGFPDRPQQIWVEVKATAPNSHEINKLRELCCLSGLHGYFAIANDDRCHQWEHSDPFREILEESVIELSVDPQAGTARPLRYWQGPHSTFLPVGVKAPEFDTPEGLAFRSEHYDLIAIGDLRVCSATALLRAAKAALSARFEHGESPR